MYTISDRGRALCVLSAEHEALQQQAKNITAELMHHMQRLSNEHKTILQKWPHSKNFVLHSKTF